MELKKRTDSHLHKDLTITKIILFGQLNKRG